MNPKLEYDLPHVQHNLIALMVNELKDVQPDTIDEAQALDDECIKVERVINGLIAGLKAKRQQLEFTIRNVWSPEEILAAKARAAGKLERMGP